MTIEKRWRLRSFGIDVIIPAPDQFAAWDTLRDRPIGDFGLIVTAEPDESANPIGIQTEALMRRWGRDDDAAQFHQLAVANGLVPS